MNRRIGEAGSAQALDVVLFDRCRFARERDGMVNQRAVARRRQGCRQILAGELTESLSVMLDSVVALIRYRNRNGDHLPFCS